MGTRIAVARRKCCTASSTPRSPAVTTTTGTAAPSQKNEPKASWDSEAGTFNSRSTRSGVRKKVKRDPTNPTAVMRKSEVHTSDGISGCRRWPIRSATNLVNARESPRSNKLKYPITTHARLMIPRRSVPKPRLSTGKHTTATTTGKQLPKRFHRVLPARDRPLGTAVSKDVTSGSRFSDAKDISWGMVFILCLLRASEASARAFVSSRRFPSLQSPILPAPFRSRVRQTWCAEPIQAFLWLWRHSLKGFQLPLVENIADQLPQYARQSQRQRPLRSGLCLPSEAPSQAFAPRRKQSHERNAARPWRSRSLQDGPVAASATSLPHNRGHGPNPVLRRDYQDKGSPERPTECA